MRTTERLRFLKEWVFKELCEGRTMKAPGKNMAINDIVWREPECHLGWSPSRLDKTGAIREDTISTIPSILIMPNQSYAKYMEEQRFDRYDNVHRPPDMGAHLNVTFLFSVYEPGIRLPGFVDSVGEKGAGLDVSLIEEGTEEGMLTLLNWMDDCTEKLLGQRHIPHTDLFVEENTMTYGLYTDQEYIVDRRPLYYGFVRTTFGCYANEGANPDINQYLL